jgi:hypothetical protein
MPVLTIDPAAELGHQGLAQRHGDEVLEQRRHVEKEAVQPYAPGSVLHGGRPQYDLGEPKSHVVASVKPGRLPGRNGVPTGQGRHLPEIPQQAPEHALRLPIDARHGEHPLARGTQDLIFRDVDGELVVPDLQRERQAVVPVQLLAFAQPAAQHR